MGVLVPRLVITVTHSRTYIPQNMGKFFFKQKTAYEITMTGVQTCALPIYRRCSQSVDISVAQKHGSARRRRFNDVESSSAPNDSSHAVRHAGCHCGHIHFCPTGKRGAGDRKSVV